jgi:hypothetical protein
MIDKSLHKLKEKEKTQIKFKMKRGILKKLPLKFIGLLRDFLKNYMPINLKSGRNRQISAHT